MQTRALALAILGQATLCYLSFQKPRYFWPLMTLGLGAVGLPGLGRLRSRPEPASLGWMVAGGLAGGLGYGITAAGALVARRLSLGRRSLDRLRECTGGVPPQLAALLVVPAAVGEEIFWRESFLGHQLRERPQPEGSALLRSTLVYGLVQMASLQPLPPLGAVLLGSGTGWLRIRSGSVWPAVLAHLVYAELCLVVPGLPASGSPPPGSSNSTT